MNKISFIMTIGLMFGNQICPNSDETISLAIKHAKVDYSPLKNDDLVLPEFRKTNYMMIYCSDNFELYKKNYIRELSANSGNEKNNYVSCILALTGAIVIYELVMITLYPPVAGIKGP